VFDLVLARMRRQVRDGGYVVTGHALEAMQDDALTLFDIERCLLTGTIVERQRDRARREWKYLVEGRTLDGRHAIVVGKIGRTNRLVILSVFLTEPGG
jgi:hypothetical protein